MNSNMVQLRLAAMVTTCGEMQTWDAKLKAKMRASLEQIWDGKALNDTDMALIIAETIVRKWMREQGGSDEDHLS